MLRAPGSATLRASAFALLAVASTTGCASFTTYLAPRATPVGALEIAGSASALAYVEDSGVAQQLPNLDLMARYGVAPGVDLGVKLGTVNLLVDARMN
ncbi:hypothetical protein L6R52_41130, partial [Myxococcota bacterium]|nr:hypothetical protein [Myxococcota bacterium]